MVRGSKRVKLRAAGETALRHFESVKVVCWRTLRMNVIIRRDCYGKEESFCPFFPVLAFVLSVQFSVLGASGPGAEDAPADMSGTALTPRKGRLSTETLRTTRLLSIW